RKAIATDPTFGNPYNDIGCYLMETGNLVEAAPWFEKAKEASRYEPRHFPYLNLGRLYAARGEFAEALVEFQALSSETRQIRSPCATWRPSEPMSTSDSRNWNFRVSEIVLVALRS